MKALWIICGVLIAGAAIGILNHRITTGRAASPGGLSSRSLSNPPVVWSGPRRTTGSSSPALLMETSPVVVEQAALMSTNWQDEIGELLTSTEMTEAEVAHRLLERFPTLPEEGQEQVALHLSFLLPDEDYSLLAPYLLSTTLPEGIADALFTGLLMRDNAVQAPLLLAIASDPTHPRAEEARSNLEALLGRELGDDPREWAALVQEFLQPDPEQ